MESPEFIDQTQGEVESSSQTQGVSFTTSESSHDLGPKRPTFAMNKCKNFCDNIAISLRTKFYVLELNFKRKYDRLKHFAGRQLSWLRRVGHPFGFGMNLGYLGDFSSEESMMAAEQERESFWKDIGPSSRESLNKQQERILNRLEQMIKENRYKVCYDWQAYPTERAKAAMASSCSASGLSCASSVRSVPRSASESMHCSKSSSEKSFGLDNLEQRETLDIMDELGVS